jgi:hypothetical protein
MNINEKIMVHTDAQYNIADFTARIGSTEYEVTSSFSESTCCTAQEIIMRLLLNEVK